MDNNILQKEIETIKCAINTNIQGSIETFTHFHIGEFIEKPNQSGCFKRNEEWYVYETDEKNYCTFCGPFTIKGIIYACGMKLHISKDMKGYRFSEEEFKIYLHNHFHSLKEIDEDNT